MKKTIITILLALVAMTGQVFYKGRTPSAKLGLKISK